MQMVSPRKGLLRATLAEFARTARMVRAASTPD